MRTSTHSVNFGAYAGLNARTWFQTRVTIICVLARIWSSWTDACLHARTCVFSDWSFHLRRTSTHSVNFGAYACLHARICFQTRVNIRCVLARIWSTLGHMRVSTHALVFSHWSLHQMSTSTSVTGGANAG